MHVCPWGKCVTPVQDCVRFPVAQVNVRQPCVGRATFHQLLFHDQQSADNVLGDTNLASVSIGA